MILVMPTGELLESHPRASAGFSVHHRSCTVPSTARNTLQNTASYPGGRGGVWRGRRDMGVRVVPEIGQEMPSSQ